MRDRKEMSDERGVIACWRSWAGWHEHGGRTGRSGSGKRLCAKDHMHSSKRKVPD